jgi:hypothetical protein
MCKNQRDLPTIIFCHVLCFEEGDEWGPVRSFEKSQIALIFSDSEHCWPIRLTQNFHLGARSQPSSKRQNIPVTISRGKAYGVFSRDRSFSRCFSALQKARHYGTVVAASNAARINHIFNELCSPSFTPRITKSPRLTFKGAIWARGQCGPGEFRRLQYPHLSSHGFRGVAARSTNPS